MSEDAAYRLIVVDALQRYRALPDMANKAAPQKRDAFQQQLILATQDNGLLAGPERVAVISEAWKRLLHSCPPEAYARFLDNETLAPLIHALPAVQPEAKGLTMMKVLGFMLKNGYALRPTNAALKQTAQEAGIIDYEGGDSLPKAMGRLAEQITAERRGTAANAQDATGHGLPPMPPSSGGKAR